MASEQTELPLRIYDQPGGAIIRCLCGIELAGLRRSMIGGVATARTVGRSIGIVGLSPDVTTPGLLAMVGHARRCERGQALLAALWGSASLTSHCGDCLSVVSSGVIVVARKPAIRCP